MAGRSGSMASRVLLWIVAHSTWCLPRYRSIKSFFDLRRDFQSERVQALREIADILQKLIVKDHRWNGGEETRRGGDQRLGDARCHGAQARGTSPAGAGHRPDEAPHGSGGVTRGGHTTTCRAPG